MRNLGLKKVLNINKKAYAILNTLACCKNE